MSGVARFLARKSVAFAIVLVVLAASAFCGSRALRLCQDDDLLAFLPAGDPDVQHFRQLAKRFGGLDVALVGIAPNSGRVFDADILRRLKKATAELSDTRGLDSVLSLDNVTDFTIDNKKGGIITGPLVLRVPRDRAGLARLRKKRSPVTMLRAPLSRATGARP